MSTSTTTPDSRTDPYEQLRNHDKIDRVVSYEEHSRFDGAMVVLDWVTDSHMENGTRIIEEKNYDGHIREVSNFIDDLPGITKTSADKTGLAEYTIHIEKQNKETAPTR